MGQRYARNASIRAFDHAVGENISGNRYSHRIQDPLRVLLVDPAVFTGPYDAALTGGLEGRGISVSWATRASPSGMTNELPARLIRPIYYPGVEKSVKQGRLSAKLRKGVSHVASTQRLIKLCKAEAFDILHFQWLVFSAVDLYAIRSIRPHMPVVLTVHDTTPFNGNPTSGVQKLGYKAALNAVDHVIVHTGKGRDKLIAEGIAPDRISVIPHGPMPLNVPRSNITRIKTDGRWTFVLFGRLQEYKGVDILVEALAQLDAGDRSRCRVIVAGEAFIDIEALQARATALGVGDLIEWKIRRLSEPEMAELFESADTFLFPYKNIEASGVYYTIKGYDKWVVASDLGAFSEEIVPGTGELIPPSDASALARSIASAIGRKPASNARSGQGWDEIGTSLATLYERLRDGRALAG